MYKAKRLKSLELWALEAGRQAPTELESRLLMISCPAVLSETSTPLKALLPKAGSVLLQKVVARND